MSLTPTVKPAILCRIMKIGIFGGTFDPIHQGHLAIAEEVRKALDLDRVILIPANRPPHKTGRKILPAKHRLAMVHLAVQGHPDLGVSDLEIKRRGKSYTVETVKALEKRYPEKTEFYLILGLDAFLEFSSWRSPAALRSRCHIVVVSRPGFRFADLSRLAFLSGMDPRPLKELDEGRRSRHEHPLSPLTRLILLRVTAHDVSATGIRAHVFGGRRVKNLLPPLVESYIIDHNLYSRTDPSS